MTEPTTTEARERLAAMIRTDRGDMNVYSEPEVRAALDAYRAAVLADPALSVPVSSPPADQTAVREQLLNAIDFSYCQTLGFGTPEGLLAAYEASRTQTVDQAALVRACASFVRDTYSGEWADDAAATLETDADKIERGEPCSLLRLAAVLPATTNHNTDTGATPPPALTEEGRLRARVQVLEEDAERDQGLAATGARCLLRGHQGQIESGSAVIEGHRFALSTKLGLGTGAPWDAIHERVAELRRVADETAATETQPEARP